jgi:hypothetical protein
MDWTILVNLCLVIAGFIYVIRKSIINKKRHIFFAISLIYLIVAFSLCILGIVFSVFIRSIPITLRDAMTNVIVYLEGFNMLVLTIASICYVLGGNKRNEKL